MITASSARRTGSVVASASEAIATEAMPIRCSVRIMRTATSPRLATRTFVNMGGSVAHDHADGCGVEPVAGVVDLGAVADDHQRGSVGLRFHPQTGGRYAVDDAERPVGINGHVHEPVDVADQVPLAQAPFRPLQQEVLGAGVLVLGVVPV